MYSRNRREERTGRAGCGHEDVENDDDLLQRPAAPVKPALRGAREGLAYVPACGDRMMFGPTVLPRVEV